MDLRELKENYPYHVLTVTTIIVMLLYFVVSDFF
jgi:hypothetical protein